MKVLGFDSTHISVDFAGKDFWRIHSKVNITAVTDEGTLRYEVFSGFPTNMRSGSHVIDPIIPKFTGNNLYNAAILMHDVNYTKMSNGDNPLSRKLADELLYQTSIMSGELGKFRAGIMYRMLRMFADGAYKGENDGKYKGADLWFDFTWSDK